MGNEEFRNGPVAGECRIVEWGIAKIPMRVDVRAKIRKCSNLGQIPQS
jgi:hypothetical protein